MILTYSHSGYLPNTIVMTQLTPTIASLVPPQQAPSPFDFPVFQAGKRICLGQRMVRAGLSTSSLYRAVLTDTTRLYTTLIHRNPHSTHTGNFRGQGPSSDAAATFLVFHRSCRGGSHYIRLHAYHVYMQQQGRRP